MNVIISNKYSQMLTLLEQEIDTLKSVQGEYEVEEFIDMFKSIYFQRMILDVTAIRNYQDVKIIQKISMELDADKIILLLDTEDQSLESNYLSKLISMGIYNFTSTKEGILYLLNTPNTYKDVAHFQELTSSNGVDIPAYGGQVTESYNAKIIGFKNVTEHAGATTLIFMLIKELQKYRNVVAIEYNKKDFQFFNNNKMISVNKDEFAKALADNKEKDFILVDLNDCPNLDICTEVLYLVEPSVVKLNKLLTRKRTALVELKGKKVVLNKSMITNEKDLKQFIYESNLEIFMNIPPLDERSQENEFLINLLQNTELFNKN